MTSKMTTLPKIWSNNEWQIKVMALPVTISCPNIHEIFGQYGDIERIAIFKNYKSKTFNCYMNFEEESDALKAVELHGQPITDGSRVHVIKFDDQIQASMDKRYKQELIDRYSAARERSEEVDRQSSPVFQILQPLFTTLWQLEIFEMPVTTTAADVECLFAEIGNLDEIGIIQNIREKWFRCYVTYEGQKGHQYFLDVYKQHMRLCLNCRQLFKS